MFWDILSYCQCDLISTCSLMCLVFSDKNRCLGQVHARAYRPAEGHATFVHPVIESEMLVVINLNHYLTYYNNYDVNYS